MACSQDQVLGRARSLSMAGLPTQSNGSLRPRVASHALELAPRLALRNPVVLSLNSGNEAPGFIPRKRASDAGPPPPARAGGQHLLSTQAAYKRTAGRPEAATSRKSLLLNKRRGAAPLLRLLPESQRVSRQGREHRMGLTPNPFRTEALEGGR